MAAVLRRYLSDAAKRGFIWGEHDCILFAAGWAQELSGEDPAAKWRGRYTCEWQAQMLLDTQGGMVTAIDNALPVERWRAVSVVALEHGDIVVASPREGVMGGEHVAGIAVDERRIAVLTQRDKKQLVVHPMPVLKAWRFRG